jgi:hypothetical protein
LELFWQFGISCFSIRFWNCSDSLVFLDFQSDFRTVLTVWTVKTVLKSDRKTRNTKLSEQFQNLIEKQEIPNYQILELFWQFGISCFSIWFWNWSDSLVFLVFRSDFRTVLTVWYFLFFDLSSKIWSKNKKYQTVRTVPKSDRKTRNTKLWEQF